MYSLKSLTRLRNSLVRQRSFYLVKITNVLDNVFPVFKPFFSNSFSATALYIINKHRCAQTISNLNVNSYEVIRKLYRNHFKLGKFFELNKLAKNTVGETNDILDSELLILLDLYYVIAAKIDDIEAQITDLTTCLDRPTLSIYGVGPISAAIIVSEFGDISRFKSTAQMMSFAGMEPGYYQSGTSEHTGKTVKHGSSHLRFTLMNVCIPLIRFNPVFATYYYKKRNEGKPHRAALSNVAKKLIRVIYTLETENIKYDSSKLRYLM